MEFLDLLARQADQGIPAAQGVIQERERMVLGQRCQPQGQLRQVHGHGILVHAVKAALGDDAAGMQDLILIRRNPR